MGHLRSDSFSSLANIGELTKEADPEDAGTDGEGIPAVKIFLEEQRLQNRQDTAGDLSVQEETEIWLRRQGVDKALVQGLGKGPDGIALAKVAAKRLKGKENGKRYL